MKQYKIAAVILTICMIMCGCGQRMPMEETEAEVGIEVETQKPVKGDIEKRSEFIGEVEASDTTDVIPLTSGKVTDTFFEEGDLVNAGDLLFTIDDTDAQLNVETAAANLESAQAAYNSAQMQTQVAQFSQLYTQAQISESLGTVETERMNLENKVASAKYALKEAEENRELRKQLLYDAQEAYDDLEDAIDDLKDDIENMKDYHDDLQRYEGIYKKIKSSSTPLDTAKNYLSNIEDYLDDPSTATAEEIALKYIERTTGADSEYELGTMVSAAASSRSSMESQRENAKDSKDTTLTSQIQAAVNYEVSKNNVLEAADAEKLTQKMLEDYDNYTTAKLIAKANMDNASAAAGIVSAQASETSAKAGVTSAQNNLESAELALDHTKVTAPVSGVIKTKVIDKYGMANMGQTAYVITSDDSLKIVFYVSDKVASALEEGQQLTITQDQNTYQAVISKIYENVEESSGLHKIEAALSGEASGLSNGMSVRLQLTTEKKDNTMLVPLAYVYYESREAYVYCAVDGKAVKTFITLGLTDEENAEVLEGLEYDSQVIQTWSSQLKDGKMISLKEVPNE